MYSRSRFGRFLRRLYCCVGDNLCCWNSLYVVTLSLSLKKNANIFFGTLNIELRIKSPFLFPGNSACVWCLVNCPKTNVGMKVQLGCFFGLLVVQCALTGPLGLVSLNSGFFCGSLRPHFRAWTYIFRIIVVELERCHFAVMAVYRYVDRNKLNHVFTL